MIFYFQSHLPNGATLAPLIISTDKTKLTEFSGSKQAYPVYLSIGNISHTIRQKPSMKATVLLAYLSTDKITSSKLTKAERVSRLHRLFHESLRHILAPLEIAGRDGINLTGGDGDIRLVFPVLAVYAADYPEQCLVTGVKYNACPKCHSRQDQFGDSAPGRPRRSQETLATIDTALSHPTRQFNSVCRDKAYNLNGHVPEPFWSNLPYTDIHMAITPDVLHQLYGGVFQHLLEWCQSAIGKEELDERIKRLPLSHGVRHFVKGFSTLTNVSGPERKEMAKILLGILNNAVPKRVIMAARAVLDFTYISQYDSHSEETLIYLNDALELLHREKGVFIDIQARKDWKIPKLHSMLHYIPSIRLFGSTGNYDTGMFERLHIDYAKQAFQATNRREERPQMLRWLDRQERISAFQCLLNLRNGKKAIQLSKLLQTREGQPILLAKSPPFPNKKIDLIQESHGVPWFSWYLKEFLHKHGLLDIPSSARRTAIQDAPLPFNSINIWTKARLRHKDIQGLDQDKQTMDSFHANPLHKNQNGKVVGRFDTVLVNEDLEETEEDNTGVQGELSFKIIMHSVVNLP